MISANGWAKIITRKFAQLVINISSHSVLLSKALEKARMLVGWRVCQDNLPSTSLSKFKMVRGIDHQLFLQRVSLFPSPFVSMHLLACVIIISICFVIEFSSFVVFLPFHGPSSTVLFGRESLARSNFSTVDRINCLSNWGHIGECWHWDC